MSRARLKSDGIINVYGNHPDLQKFNYKLTNLKYRLVGASSNVLYSTTNKITLNSEEIDKVLHQITLHKEYTGSRVASEILKNWKIESGKFVKVIPTDYKKALQKQKNSVKQNEGVKVHG
jgi:glutamate synthase domain-containing protein 3